METIKINKKKVLMIAHRGLSGFERENTIPAFVAAGNKTYYGCECDIHPTTDGEFVVIHDSDTMRVSGESKIIEECTFEEVKEIELLGLFDGVKNPSLRIPTLREYILCCKRYDKKCIIEFKEQFTKENVFKVINICRELDYLTSCIFISFYPNNLIYVKEIDQTIPCQFLLSENRSDGIEFCINNQIDLDINFHQVSKELVDLMHQHGLKVNVWTVNKEEDGNLMVEYGVDFITTNILE